MVLVVAGHLDNGTVGLSGPFDLFEPYSYHVAAFVFVSGYFYKPYCEANPAHYIVRKLRRFMVPLYLISFVYGFVWAFARMSVGVSNVSLPTIANLLVDPILSGHQYRLTTAMWFLTPLFCAEVFNVLCRIVLGRIWWASDTLRESVLFAVYMLLGAVAITIGGESGLKAGWLLLVCRTLFFISCFGMGRFYASVLEKHDRIRSTWYFSFVLLARMATTIAFGNKGTYTASWCKFPNGIVGTYVVTILGIAFLLRVCKLLGPVLGRGKAILSVADNSFSIMCHHMFAFFIVNSVIYAISIHGHLFESFDYDAFVSNYKYAYAVRGCPQFDLVYIAFAIAFSIAIHRVWEWIKFWMRRLVKNGKLVR